jgi:hypothetical protein
VRAKVLEHGQVGFQLGHKAVKFVPNDRESIDVEPTLQTQGFANFSDLITVVEILNRLFESNGDEEPNNDSCNMDEEIRPRLDSCMGRVNV